MNNFAAGALFTLLVVLLLAILNGGVPGTC